MTTATAQAVTCPLWCQEEHTDRKIELAGFVFHHSRLWRGVVTPEAGPDLYWQVDIAGSDDQWAGIYTEAVEGMTPDQARAMAQALIEVADVLEAAQHAS